MNKYSKTRKTRKIRWSRILTKSIIAIAFIILLFFLIMSVKIYYIATKESPNSNFTDGQLEMIMFNVGQGDAFLLLQNDEAVLVDTGVLHDWNAVRKSLKKIGIKELNYLIITHPHQDHSGGMFSILANMKVQHVIIPNVQNKGWSKSEKVFFGFYNAYLKYVNSLYGENLVKTSDQYSNGLEFSDSTINFLSPKGNSYNKLNNYSLVMKVNYKNTDILLTGDIEREVEKKMVDSGVDVTADIYTAAHHGSRTSNINLFLDAVNPRYVMISSDNGRDNLYGHPVKRFMRYLESHNIPVYRTDELGTVIMTTDGEDIEFDSSPGDYRSGKEILNSKKLKS